MQITYKYSDKKLIVYLSGELDHHTAKKTRDAIDDIISLNPVKTLVLDMSKIGFMDSSGVGLVLGRYKLMREAGGNVELIAPNPAVKRIFEMSGVTKLITLV